MSRPQSLSEQVNAALTSDTSHVQRPPDPTFEKIEDECQWLADSIVTPCIQNHDRVRRMKIALGEAALELRLLRRRVVRATENASRLYEAGKAARIALDGQDSGNLRFESDHAQVTYDEIWALKQALQSISRQLAEFSDRARSAPATMPAPPPEGPADAEPGESGPEATPR